MTEDKIPLMDLVLILAEVTDLVSRELRSHNLETAYIAGELAAESGLNRWQTTEVVIAAALHDIGALSLKDKLAVLEFEMKSPQAHSEMGYRLMKTFPPFTEPADLVRFHHVPWDHGKGLNFQDRRVPPGSHILNLADRISVLMKGRANILDGAEAINAAIAERSGSVFQPELVEAFLRLSAKPAFWLNAVAPENELAAYRDELMPALSAGSSEMYALTKMMSHIIDFRNPGMVAHSAGVAAAGRELAWLSGCSEHYCRMVELAGYLHDLGKLSVPAEILEKKSLTSGEMNLIRAHPFQTRRTLLRLPPLAEIGRWAGDHHERLDGSGYPFRLTGKDLPAGSRIIAVADVFAAIREPRPYQRTMDLQTALCTVERLADGGKLDRGVTELLKKHSRRIDTRIAETRAQAERTYREFVAAK